MRRECPSVFLLSRALRTSSLGTILLLGVWRTLWREFAGLDVARVDLRKMLPLLGQVVQREDG